MALTLGFTSMDQATETALRAAFAKANEQFNERFSLAAESAADFVVIDMDSMYGPMGWLRLHAAGKQVVGLTAAPRTQADFRLGRPFDTAAMVELLREIAHSAGEQLDAAPATRAESPDQAPAEGVPSTAPADTAAPSDAAEETGAPAPAEAETPPPAETVADPEPALEPTPAVPDSGITLASKLIAEATPEPEPEPEPEPPSPPRDPVFADWLQPGALAGRLRYRRDDAPELWIDADARQYHGPAQLKPLTGYFEGTVQREDFEVVDEAAWNSASTAAGQAQPLARLQWLGGLLAGNGALLPGNDPQGRYRLTKWPQAEREYPRQFRIATAMMKGPATLAEIAEASGVPLAEVADFTNANLATGYAEFVPEPEPEPEAPKPTGFFGRLRGKS